MYKNRLPIRNTHSEREDAQEFAVHWRAALTNAFLTTPLLWCTFGFTELWKSKDEGVSCEKLLKEQHYRTSTYIHSRVVVAHLSKDQRDEAGMRET